MALRFLFGQSSNHRLSALWSHESSTSQRHLNSRSRKILRNGRSSITSRIKNRLSLMATFSNSTSTLLLLLSLILNSPPCLSLQTSSSYYSNFDPEIELLGGAHFSDDGSRMVLTTPSSSTSALVFYKSPFKFAGSRPSKISSFATEFSFSFTGNGNGLSFVMGPFNFGLEFVGRGKVGDLSEKGYVGIDFGASMDGKLGRLNASLVVGNISPMHVVANNGEKFRSWVDYDGSSKRLEVRLSKFGGRRPDSPMIAYAVDLLKLWGDDEVYVALGSLNGNSSETCLYSWRFRLSKFPNSMHSLPADPHGYVDEQKDNEGLTSHKRFCPIAILAGMISATGWLAFVVLFIWAIFLSRRSTVLPIEGNMFPIDNYGYEKINIVAIEKDDKIVKN